MINTTDRNEHSIVDLQEVADRYRSALSAIRNRPFARLRSKTPTGRKLDEALDTIPLLYAELMRLRDRLARTLVNLHNLAAAARATLSADRDGEADPLYYLRDELQAQGHLPADHRERP